MNMIKWLDHRVAQPPSCWVHSDNVYGGPGSLSDARLKEEATSVSGDQALRVLSQIEAYTYKRKDIGERRLGFLVDDRLETALEELAIDNVLGQRWYNNDSYRTIDYSRMVTLCVAGINKLAKRVEYLEPR